MIRRFFVLSLVLMTTACAREAAVPDVIVDHDGGVDDLIAMSLLMKSAAVHVQAVAVCPADSLLEPATRATGLFLDLLGGQGIAIAQGHVEGTNPFPDAWRKDASRVLGITGLQGKQPGTVNRVVDEDAARYLATRLSEGRPYTILETGPLTNIAGALKINPAIKNNITRIYVMGGAVRVPGNVEQPGHDGSAEWNIFNEPQAAADVIQSGIPITLVPLDATNKVPLTRGFLDRLKAQSSVASTLASQAWELVADQHGSSAYYFWDALTAAAMLDPTVVTVEHLKIRVVTDGVSRGRTIEDPAGSAVDVALDARQDKVERLFLDVLGR